MSQKMEDLCTACLCVGRNLFFIGETGCYNLYYQILSEIEVYDMSMQCVRVCWECRAVLRRFQRFKAQAQHCYTSLLHHAQQQIGSPISLVKETNLKIQQVINIMYPDDVVKSETEEDTVIDGFKCKTIESEAETHCEPETFVRDLNLDQPEELSTKKKKVKIKKKTKRKRKSEVKLDIVSDSEPWPDCDIGEDQKVERLPGDEEQAKDCDVANAGEEVNNEDTKDVSPVNGISVAPARPPPAARAPRSRELLPDRPQCVECGKIFSSKKTYRYHLNVLHKGQNQYPCPRCGKVYQWKSNLGRHLRSHKARDSGELRCSPCGKLFASVATYRQHLRVSRRHVPEAEFSYTCDECGKKFVNKTRLRDHIDWEHLKKIKFRCHICNKPYKCHTSLYVHLQNVHRNKDAKENLCHVCGKSYQNAAKLKYHIVAMHTSETPYQCERCSASFGWYSSLYRHVREVHYKMKVQPKKNKKGRKIADGIVTPLPPPHPLATQTETT